MGRTKQGSKRSPAKLALKNFASQWFLISQGTGIIAVILHQLDYQFNGLYVIADIFWVLTILLLATTTFLYILRGICFPSDVLHTLATDANELSCLASPSITFTTIIQMIALTVVRDWSHGFGTFDYVLWWINVFLAACATIGIPYVVSKYCPPGVGGLMPPSQLPLIAALTAAAGGGVICQYAELSPSEQIPVIIVSYLFIGLALPLALGFDTLFLTRLMERESPSGLKVYQEMILCGPWGQGSFALQSLGNVVMSGAFASYSKGVFLTAAAAQPVGFASIFAGLISWGQGTFWWAFALISIVHTACIKKDGKRGLGFGLPTWSLVFPWVCRFLGGFLVLVRLTNDCYRVYILMLRWNWASCWIRTLSRFGLPLLRSFLSSYGSSSWHLRFGASSPGVYWVWNMAGKGQPMTMRSWRYRDEGTTRRRWSLELERNQVASGLWQPAEWVGYDDSHFCLMSHLCRQSLCREKVLLHSI
jgi:tellurite resistance protein TehA-like permease